MKKIFTSISMALCLAASSFNASAQQATQLSDAQKQEIQQKVLPVVFEQIKEQAGIDILGWAQPKLTADYLGSLPGFSGLKSSNGLRADGDLSVQPDSIKLDVTKLSSDPMLGLLGELTVKFVNPQTRTIPLIEEFFGRNVTIGVPEEIRVISSVLQEMAVIKITTEGVDGAVQPFTMDMTLSLFESEPIDLLGYSCVLNSTTNLLELKVEIKDTFRNFWTGLSSSLGDITLPSLPDSNYMITVNLGGIYTSNQLAMSLYGLPLDGGNQVAMGDAVVAIDMAALQGGMPIQYIDITSYETGTANAWSRLQFNMWQAEQDLILQIDNIVYSDADRDFSITPQRYTITMSDNTVNVTDVQSAANAVIQNVVSQLANDGEAAPYEMAITTTIDTNGDGMVNNDDNTLPVMNVKVTPTMASAETKSVAITGATINIVSYSYSETGDATTTEVNLNVTANEDKIALDIAMGDNVIGCAYFTSNIWNAVTSNEDIQLANVEVTPVKDGIYVSGTTAASYRIVSMSGATVANGTVSGDNAYISTSALAKGIYVIVVTENGESKAIKFAR